MKKMTRMFMIFASAAAVSVYAANPASTEYVDKKVRILEAADNNLQAQINNISGGGGGGGSSGHYIGEYYQGGVIYWLDPMSTPANSHGLIADINDAPLSTTTGYLWDASGSPVATGATGNEAYAGIANTALILSTVVPSSNAQAANFCASSTNQGVSNWYLPSMLELTSMFDEEMAITRTAKAHGGTAFTYWNNPISGSYCSSTETDSNDVLAFVPSLALSQPDLKNANYIIRCIRAF